MRMNRRTLKSKRSCGAASNQLGGKRRRTVAKRRVRKTRNIKRGGSALQTAAVPVLLLALNQLFGSKKRRPTRRPKRSFRRRRR
tara:strand:- start:112 stop:363 length:252 start_codon:yes stop_codon:yes gene_type:complete